jgi:hypothetical protein
VKVNEVMTWHVETVEADEDAGNAAAVRLENNYGCNRRRRSRFASVVLWGEERQQDAMAIPAARPEGAGRSGRCVINVGRPKLRKRFDPRVERLDSFSATITGTS